MCPFKYILQKTFKCFFTIRANTNNYKVVFMYFHYSIVSYNWSPHVKQKNGMGRKVLREKINLMRIRIKPGNQYELDCSSCKTDKGNKLNYNKIRNLSPARIMVDGRSLSQTRIYILKYKYLSLQNLLKVSWPLASPRGTSWMIHVKT